MELNGFDHITAAVLAIVLPAWAVWEFQRLKRRLDAGVPNARLNVYRLTMAVEWGLSAAVITLWVVSDRSLETLGLGLEAGLRPWTGAALALLGSAFLILQLVSALRNPKNLRAVRKQLGRLEPMLPHTEAEARAFMAVSVTAGVCEELLYRGFLIAYFESIAGIWAAVLVSSVIFGLGHTYQGAKGVIKTGIVGLVMAGIYQLAGSLWAPMFLHAAVDMVSGHLGRRAIEQVSAESESPSSG